MIDKHLVEKLGLLPTRDGIHILPKNKKKADWMEWKDNRPQKPFQMRYRLLVSDHDMHGDQLDATSVMLVAVTNVPDNQTAYYSIVHPVIVLMQGDEKFLTETVRLVLESGLTKVVEKYLSRN